MERQNARACARRSAVESVMIDSGKIGEMSEDSNQCLLVGQRRRWEVNDASGAGSLNSPGLQFMSLG